MASTNEASQFQFQFSRTGDGTSRPSKDFKRAYMACEPCRKTKAKCVLPESDGPCIKCQRERRDCVFSAERSARKRQSQRGSETNANDRAKRVRRDARDSPAPTAGSRDRLDPQRVSHSAQYYQEPHFVSNSGLSEQANGAVNVPVNTVQSGERDLDSEVMRTVVSSSNDALGLLFRAAEQQEQSDGAADPQPLDADFHDAETPGSNWTSAVKAVSLRAAHLSSPEPATIQVWEQFRFCRMGWFSPREAVTFIDLFFRNMFPLTPVLTNFYSNHENHALLVSRDPLLCCTMLMISSRYHILPGQGGISRAHFIHNRLWNHCEHLVHRITFGQEKYSTAKTRTLASIEALLLMTEWHPRALHFPPESDGWDASLAPTIDDSCRSSTRDEDANLMRWREEVFEPAKRSDRMSWMTLGLATTLAHELGVFDTSEVPQGSPQDSHMYSKLRIRKLLYVYVNQLASRLGCTSLLPQSTLQSFSDLSEIHHGLDKHQEDSDTLVSLWIDITKLLKTATEMFFPNQAFTAQLLKSGRYIGLLEHFQPLLVQWQKRFEAFKSEHLPAVSRRILYVDYQYVRMYINSLAIQALVERASVHDGSAINLDLDILRLENRQDFKFTQEVTEASGEILQTAVSLAEDGILMFAPVRVFIRITSASIFLLKALSLGARNAELQKSLSVLESCIQALRSRNFDDIHLSSRYATLIARHVKRFRRNFRVHSRFSGSGPTASPTPPRPTRQFDRTASGNLGPVNSSDELQVGQMPLGQSSNSFQISGGGDLAFDDWLSQPFDPSIAPFGLGNQQSTSGFEMDSLDFLWSLDGLKSG